MDRGEGPAGASWFDEQWLIPSSFDTPKASRRNTVDQFALRRLLRGGGYKLTDPRGAVLALLDGPARGHIHRGGAVRGVTVKVPDIRRAMLICTLDLLIDLGALERVRLSGGQEGYVLCGPPHQHHNVCSACGAIGEIEDCPLESALSAAVQRSGLTLWAHALKLTGVCAGCTAGAE